MAAPQQPLTFNDVFEEEDVDEPKAANSVHHIRANSSIMQMKKILGECWSERFSGLPCLVFVAAVATPANCPIACIRPFRNSC